MGEVRACAHIFVTLLSFQAISAKPFFGNLWCDFLCDDDESSDDSSYDYGFCDGCYSHKTPPVTPITSEIPESTRTHPGQMSVVIPPSNGVNLTLFNVDGTWQMTMMPWGEKGAVSTTASAGAPAATFLTAAFSTSPASATSSLASATTVGPIAAAVTTPGDTAAATTTPGATAAATTIAAAGK